MPARLLILAIALSVSPGSASNAEASNRPGPSARGSSRVARNRPLLKRWSRPANRQRPNHARAARIRRRLPRHRTTPRALARSLRRGDILVLDLDNTVVDTRPRTLEAARRFAKRDADLPPETVSRIEGATIDDVGFNAAETAARLGIPTEHHASFEALWEEVFWDAASLALDAPIQSTIELARDAASRGIEVRYLTGRRMRYRQATLQQLARLGLPLAETGKLTLKPEGLDDTPQFKRQKLEALSSRGRVLFVDDSSKNLAALRELKGVSSFQVDFPVREPGWRRVPGTVSLGIAPGNSR